MVTLNAERLATYERRTGWLLTAAAVFFLVVYAWPILDPDLPTALVRACSIANITIWTGFGVDYLVRLTLAPSKRRFAGRTSSTWWSWYCRCCARCGRCGL